MMTQDPPAAAIDRRLAIGSGLALAASLPLARTQLISRVITQRGIAGGGLVQFAEGEAQFSLSVSSLTRGEDEADGEPIFLGSVVWVDTSVGLALESTQITNYENLQLAEGEGRRIEGVFAAGESGDQRFVLDATHNDLPGAGEDRIVLRVGLAAAGMGTEAATPGAVAGFTYSADGTVVMGDLETTDFGIDLESGEIFAPDAA